jgi:oligopeptide/dipeptide ABC transporter ATP-binding protein
VETDQRNDGPLLEVRDLRTSFLDEAGVIPAVDGVSLRIPRGKTVALVGESGCGKSVTALSIMRLIPQPPGRIEAGQVLFAESHSDKPIDLLQLSDREMRKVRGNRIAMIFQEPLTSLNPVYSVGEQIVEAIELHQPLRGKAARSAAVEMLGKVGIPAPGQRVKDYPHQMSGGMRQRVMLAMALSCRPLLLIADEPTTALDVTIQLQILDLLRALQADTGMSVLMITHDLGVVAEVADYVYVMYAGRIVEHTPVNDLFAHPLHPYTQGLLRCTPRLFEGKERLEVIPGSVPDPSRMPAGCRFHPRCRLSSVRASEDGRAAVAVESAVGDPVLRRCIESYGDEPSGVPLLRELAPAHFVACWEVDGA